MRRFIGCRAIHGSSSVSCVLPAPALLAAVAGPGRAVVVGPVAIFGSVETGARAWRTDVSLRRFASLHRPAQSGAVFPRTESRATRASVAGELCLQDRKRVGSGTSVPVGEDR